MSPAGGDAGGKGRLEHLPRFARVAHDQDLGMVHRRGQGRRAAQLQGEVGSQKLSRDPADPVRPEQPHEAN